VATATVVAVDTEAVTVAMVREVEDVAAIGWIRVCPMDASDVMIRVCIGDPPAMHRCDKLNTLKPRQPAYEIFSIECRFQQFKSGPSKF